jgi:hypothetical protein
MAETAGLLPHSQQPFTVSCSGPVKSDLQLHSFLVVHVDGVRRRH